MVSDAAGDRCKRYELSDNAKRAMPGIPLLARLDGKSFHTFTRGLARPYDTGMQTCMVETTKYLVEQSNACIGYTQSDEITLAWFVEADSTSQYPFDGRMQKLTSVLASMASAKFAKLLPEHLPTKAHLLPVFDCRVWQVPTKQDAFDVFLWREDDATKNSITMAASSYYSHKDLHKKNSSEKQELLFQKGVNWNDYPASFRRGQFVRRSVVQRRLNEAERLKIPERNRPDPDLLVTRSVLQAIDAPPLRKIKNHLGFIFDKESPEPRTAVDTKSNMMVEPHESAS